MAQPKRRWSKARTHKRRSTWKLEEATLGTCPRCHEPIMPHRVCSNCGYYNGKEIVAKKENEEA
ncbi:MAG: 50S ribosomal protein L32 [Clostridia bacterium]|nr:50S ribosomal protein L32 [Clostridia bacterium]